MIDSLKFPTSRRYGAASPLRYPGGKAALAGLFADVLAGLNLDDAIYVEPYAGGAGAGIALLQEGLVSRLVINDIDPAVFAFWTAATAHTDELINLVRTASLNIDEWRRQREIYRASTASPLELGFAFFYLNRTNRSGVLNAGVIGGNDQTGNYKIDARFNRDTLESRLAAIGALSDRIEVTDLDGRTVIRNYSQNPSAFLYIDPPYVQAGSQLYLNAFETRDHEALARVVQDIDAAHWLMTYDLAPLVQYLYAKQFHCLLELNYSARYPGRAQELLVASPEVAAELRRLHSLQVAVAV